MYNSSLRRKQLDSLFSAREYPRIKNGYISEVRHALAMSATQLARRMDLAPSTVHDLEANERKGTITINSLEKCAAAMGCRLVYAIVPETSLEDLVDKQALKRATEIAQSVQRTMALEKQSVSDEVTAAMIRDKADELRLRGGRDLWS
jgi:predicted DNA-binding mobile mystery protein A